MSPTFATNRTIGGFTCGEVSSAMQKSIRRGLEQQALFWASELDLTGYGEYVWKRLRVIASEDVGIAEPMLPAQIRALYENWLDQKKKQKATPAPSTSDRLFTVHAVLLLCRAKKSRIVDTANIAMYRGDRKAMGMTIPDWALDKHTYQGRRMGRGWDHFWTEGTKLENEAGLEDPYLAAARDARRDTPDDSDDVPDDPVQGSIL